MEDEILINNVKYLSYDKHLAELKEISNKLKELERKNLDEKSEAKRFSEGKYLKLIKSLSQIFQIHESSISEEFAVNNGITVIDPANVCCVIGKTEESKRLLAMFSDFEVETKPQPTLDFSVEDGEEKIQKVKLSEEYLSKIMAVLKIDSDSITITAKHDYPACLENKYFKFILAPRVENGDD